MRALITGGAGFVGRVLQEHLRAFGDDVVVSDRSLGGPDISNRDAVFDHVRDAGAEVVYHLAGQAHVPTSWVDPIGTLRANVEGTQNVLDAARAAGVQRVLAVTSAEVYGLVTDADLPISEHQPLHPTNPYAASKVAADAVAAAAHLGSGQDVIRLRAFNHIGPGQRADFVAAGLAARIADAEADGVDHIMVGNLRPRRDFTDVRDVVRAYRLVAEHGLAGEVYNVCSGIDRSIGELAERLIELSGRQLELRPDPDLQRPSDNPILRGDNRRLRSATGWTPELTLDQSLDDVLQDARSRRNA
jgi:GDP-4-dehydro-6-deoxy-D-mannose reductase